MSLKPLDIKPQEFGNIHWLPKEEYQKALDSVQASLNDLLFPLRMYGQGEYCDETHHQIMELFEDFGLRVRGLDVPISSEVIKREHWRKESKGEH
jgi:hypothetical protein